MRYRVVVVFLCLGLLCNSLRAQAQQPSEWMAIHARAGFGYNIHSSELSNFEGVADCGIFTKGTSLHAEGSLTLEVALSKTLFLGLGARYTDRSAVIFADNTSAPALDVTKQSGVDVVFENTISTTLRSIDILPEIRWQCSRIGTGIQRLSLGAVAVFASSPTFLQQQRIVSPENAVYKSNNQQTVTLSKGTQAISSINSPIIGVSAGVENMLPMGPNTSFTQQLQAEYLLSDVVSSASWKVLSIRFDIGLRFALNNSPAVVRAPEPPPPPVPTPDKPPVIVQEKQDPVKPTPILRASIDSVDLHLQTGNELRASIPLVNVVFFDQNSAVIPERYYKKADQVQQSDDAFEFHRAILFSVARIMSANPNATVTLEAATSGSDEHDGLSLATQRAQAVREALVAAGVDASRISTRALLNPRIASNAEYAQGREENRRVDIILNNAPLQEYVATQKFAQLIGSYKQHVELEYFESGEARVRSNVAKEEIYTKSESRRVEVNQRLNKDNGSFTLELNATAPPFLIARDEVALDLASLRRENIVLNLQAFDAILRFDYNSSEFSQANKELLRQLVEALPAGSTIEILGSADALGDEASNRQLSERRAASTESFIKSISGSKFKLASSVSTQKFDESRPEGRFLNRSIRIRVRD